MSDSVWSHRRQPTRFPHPWNPPGKNTGVGCHFLLQCMKVKSETEVAQSCLTPRDPMDCSLPGSSIHGICQERVLEWFAIVFSTSLGSTLILVLYFHHICCYYLHWNLQPWKSSMRAGINFFQTLVNVDILTSSHGSWVFLMASRMMTPFQKIFNLLCPDSWKESLPMTVITLQNVFLKEI